eukprot:12285032-Karenia_brevis.AAC.1
MACRIIKITTALNRLWGAVRMKDMEGWINAWKCDEMFSGVAGIGAEECAYLTALDIEYKKIMKRHLSVGSIDVFKCFDQILRPLIIRLATAAGMPRGVCKAYEGYISKMTVMFQIGKTLGAEHEDRASIPQGC